MAENHDFLTLETVDEALARLCALWRPAPRQEMLGTCLAQGRVLAEDALAAADLPAFVRSAMDGFAVRDGAPGEPPGAGLRSRGGGRGRARHARCRREGRR